MTTTRWRFNSAAPADHALKAFERFRCLRRATAFATSPNCSCTRATTPFQLAKAAANALFRRRARHFRTKVLACLASLTNPRQAWYAMWTRRYFMRFTILRLSSRMLAMCSVWSRQLSKPLASFRLAILSRIFTSNFFCATTCSVCSVHRRKALAFLRFVSRVRHFFIDFRTREASLAYSSHVEKLPYSIRSCIRAMIFLIRTLWSRCRAQNSIHWFMTATITFVSRCARIRAAFMRAAFLRFACCTLPCHSANAAASSWFESFSKNLSTRLFFLLVSTQKSRKAWKAPASTRCCIFRRHRATTTRWCWSSDVTSVHLRKAPPTATASMRLTAFWSMARS